MRIKHYFFSQSKLLHFSFFLVVFCLVASCKDDEDTYIEVPAEDVFTLMRDSLQVEFHLLNERGDTTTVFNEGEDIIFDLKMTNHSSREYNIGLITNLFTNDLFRVFTADGIDIGTSFHYPDDMVGDGDINSGPGYSILPGNTYHCRCSWKGNKEIYNTWAPFHYNSQIPALGKGRYYTIAKIRLGYQFHEPDTANKGLIFTCGIHFAIE